MADLSQAYSEAKSLPDSALQKELSSPTGMIPGYIILGEMQERRSLRSSGPVPEEKPSLASEYIGRPFARGGMVTALNPFHSYTQGLKHQKMLSTEPSLMMGISALPNLQAPSAPVGLDTLVPLAPGEPVQPEIPQAYKKGGRVGADKLTSMGDTMQGLSDRKAGFPEKFTPRNSEYIEDLRPGKSGDPFFEYARLMAGNEEQYRQSRYPEKVSIGDWLFGEDNIDNDTLIDKRPISSRKDRMPSGWKEMKEVGGKMVEAGYPWLDGGNLTIPVSYHKGDEPGGQLANIKNLIEMQPPQRFARGGVVNQNLTPYQRALLETISGPESAGRYNVIYGGGTFDDYSRHPGQAVRIQNGPNAGRTSSAAGKYQFLGSTWDDIAQRHGLSDFSPANQDLGAWHLAKENFARQTGGNLDTVLQSGDPNQIAGVGQVLNSTWTSLPGGIEQGTNVNRFLQAYNKNLTGAAAAPAVAAAQTAAQVAPVAQAAQAAQTNPFGGLMSLAMMAQMQQPKPAPAMGSGTAPRFTQRKDPEQVTAETSQTPDAYRRRRRA